MIVTASLIFTILLYIRNKAQYQRYLIMLKYKQNILEDKKIVEKDYNDEMTYDDYDKVDWKKAYELGHNLDDLNRKLKMSNNFIQKYEKSYLYKILGYTYKNKH